MGLDSLELLMSFEDYFSINVSDAEAENISTVQQMVDCAAHHLNISRNDTTLKSHIYEKIKTFFRNNHISDNSLLLTDKIFDFLNPDDKMLWTELSKNLDSPEIDDWVVSVFGADIGVGNAWATKNITSAQADTLIREMEF